MNPVIIFWGVKKNKEKKRLKKRKGICIHTQPLNSLMHSFNYKEYKEYVY